jgi:short-subunit dehydrogenase
MLQMYDANAEKWRLRRQRRWEHWSERYGPWAVITGASDGIGRETARCLAEAKLNLVLVSRRHAVLEELAAHLAAQHGIETRVVAADLSMEAGATAVADATSDLDVGLLVAAAGFGTSGLFVNAPIERELEMIDLNCRAVVDLSHRFGRRFVDRGRGGLVLMSSLVALQGVPHAANYAATKAYVQSLAEGLHIELAPAGVDVLASLPGPVNSGFARRADMQFGWALSPEDVAAATLAALGRRTTVRPGMLSKFLSASLAPLPRPARVRVMGGIMAGMAKPRARQ